MVFSCDGSRSRLPQPWLSDRQLIRMLMWNLWWRPGFDIGWVCSIFQAAAYRLWAVAAPRFDGAALTIPKMLCKQWCISRLKIQCYVDQRWEFITTGVEQNCVKYTSSLQHFLLSFFYGWAKLEFFKSELYCPGMFKVYNCLCTHRQLQVELKEG